jgi:sugar lactone lactonase YvrE
MVDKSGDFYFVDAKRQTIYRWPTSAHHLPVVRDNPLDPVQLAFDKSGNLMVISYEGKALFTPLNQAATLIRSRFCSQSRAPHIRA